MRQVEAFRAVMLSGGVTAASAMLHISQPSVSRLIADLEHSVGFSLFDRRAGRMIPTAQARLLYDAVHRTFTGLDLLDQAARRIRAHPVGTVRIVALAAIAARILPPVIAAFRLRHADVKLTVEVLGQRAIEDRIFLGQADLGIGAASRPREGIRVTPLADVDYVCVLPVDHRLAAREHIELADLDGEEFIGPMHESAALWDGIDAALEHAGVAVRRRLETQQSHALCAFVEAGLGVAIAEPFSAQLFERLGLVARPIAPAITYAFVMLEPDIGPTPDVVARLKTDVAESTRATLDHVGSYTAR